MSCGVDVRKRPGNPKTRKLYRIWGFGPDVEYGVHNNSLTNLLRALVERVYYVNTASGLKPTPRPTTDFSARLCQFKALLIRATPLVRPVDYKQFVEYYRGRMKSVYERAVDSLLQTPVRKADAQVKSFVKAEKIKDIKADKPPRLIQPRDPRYNVEVGVYLRPLEKLVYRGIAKIWGGITVLKVNAAEQAAALRTMWDQFVDPVAVGLDASRFDQHVSRDALAWEHSVYLSLVPGAYRARLARLLTWQLTNHGRCYLADARVKYTVDGCRMSGDINTSLGNCLIMCAMVWEYCRSRGVTARLANNGDDCVVIMSQRQLGVFMGGLSEWFLEMGFTMTVEPPVKVFEQIEFCQSHPVWCGDGWRMVRNPHTAVAKDLTSLLNLEQGLEAYLGAVGLCGLSMSGGVPVFQALYQAMARAGRASSVMDHPSGFGGLWYLSQGMKTAITEPTPEARVSFWLAYGILPDEQVELEQHLRNNPIPSKLPLILTRLAPLWSNYG